jgi:hypothetical protein
MTCVATCRVKLGWLRAKQALKISRLRSVESSNLQACSPRAGRGACHRACAELMIHRPMNLGEDGGKKKGPFLCLEGRWVSLTVR